jgi:tetratricopeptide (TPR) repeat protein
LKALQNFFGFGTDMSINRASEMFQGVLEEAENLKKRADILFATNKHELAIETYNQGEMLVDIQAYLVNMNSSFGIALRRLAFIAGYAVGELCVIRCFSNQAQCFLKLGQSERALASINMAFTVPSIAHDGHMLSKLWVRKAIALENLSHDEEALSSIDRAIALGVGQEDEYDSIRNRLIEKVVAKANRLVPIPPKPVPIAQSVVNATITKILISYQDIDKLGSLLQSLIKQRAWIDCEDDRYAT